MLTATIDDDVKSNWQLPSIFDIQIKLLMEKFCPITWKPSYMNFNFDYFRSKIDKAKALGLGILIICSIVMFYTIVDDNLKGNNKFCSGAFSHITYISLL